VVIESNSGYQRLMCKEKWSNRCPTTQPLSCNWISAATTSWGFFNIVIFGSLNAEHRSVTSTFCHSSSPETNKGAWLGWDTASTRRVWIATWVIVNLMSSNAVNDGVAV